MGQVITHQYREGKEMGVMRPGDMMPPKTGQGFISLDDLYDLSFWYKKAVKEEKDQFTFKGMDILTSYAKYLIEYMIMQKNRNNRG